MGRRTLALFFAVAFLFRLLIAVASGMFHRPYLTEMEGIAWNVSVLRQYALYGTPSAYSTPVFPLFLAGVYQFAGTGLAARVICIVAACAASALRCALVPLFVRDAGFDLAAAKLAGWLSVSYIAAMDTEANGGLDGPYVALALLVLIWAAMRIWRNRTWETRTHWAFFVFLGFSALLNPSVLTVIGGSLLTGLVACRAGARRRYLAQAALSVAGILLFLGPWAIRNDLALGAPVLTRCNFGIEFWVSNGPDRTFDHPYNYETYHPAMNVEERKKVAELGEVEYSREKFAEGMEWVRLDPGGFLEFMAERIVAWWFPPHPLFLVVPKLALTLLAFAGLWLMFRREQVAAWLFLITWVTFPDVYYLVQWSSRYRFPMEWQLVVGASVALAAGWQALRARQKAARHPHGGPKGNAARATRFLQATDELHHESPAPRAQSRNFET